jgi:glycosyltransferase involved in cell wall biosynthesis
MKILLAAHHSPPNHVGGVEWITQHAAKWLQNHGQEVEIASVEETRLLPGGEVTSWEDEFQGIRIHRLSIPAKSEAEKFQQSYWNQSIERWFEKHLINTRPDILHLQSGYLLTLSVLEAASQLGIATVLSLHDYWTICPRTNLLHPNGERCPGPEKTRCAWCLLTERQRYRWPDALIGKSISKILSVPMISKLTGVDFFSNQIQERQDKLNTQLRKVDVILAHAKLAQDLVLQQGLEPEKVLLSPYGLDTSDWQQPLPFKTPSDKFRIGYLGNLIPIKGAQVLVNAFRHLTSNKKMLELRVYGDPEKLPAFGRQLRWLAGGDNRIGLMGAYDNQHLPEILQEIDVLVVPSLWYETGPLVTLEGFACLTPVVVSNIPNMVNQVTDGVDGLVFKVGSVESLANVLQRLIDEPGLLAHLTYGIRPVKSHDEQMQEWMQAYQMALEGRK